MSRESILAQELRTAKMIESGFSDIARVFEEKAKERTSKTELIRKTINETEVYWNDKVSDLKSTVKDTGTVIDDQIHSVINTNIQKAADSQISLVSETDPKNRRILQNNVRNAEKIVSLMGDFTGALLDETKKIKEQAPSIYGQDGSYIINGKDEEESLDYLSAINVLNKQNKYPESSKVDLNFDDKTEQLTLSISGKREDGKKFSVKLNAADYMQADGVDAGLISEVPSFSEQNQRAKDYSVIGGKGASAGGIKPGFLIEGRDVVAIRGGKYELLGAKEVNVKSLESQVKKEVFTPAAAGVFEVNLNGFTPEGMTWNQFNNISDPVVQRNILADAMSKKFMYDEDTGLVSAFETSGEGENKKYYNPSGQIREIEITPKVNEPTTAEKNALKKEGEIKEQSTIFVDEFSKAISNKTIDESYFLNKKVNGKNVDVVDVDDNIIKLYKTVGSGEKVEDQLIARYDLTKKKQLQSLLDEIAVGKLGNDDFSRKIRFSIEKMLGEKDIKPYTRTPDNTGQFPLEAGYTGAYDNLNTKD
jgi:predicted transcriptional regulator